MALPSPDDYQDWREYIKALISALDAGAIAQMISNDPYAASVVASAGVGAGAPVGFSPVWLKDDDALLYLGQSDIPPTAGPLFNIDTSNLADVAITFEKIAAGAVATTHIQALAITSALIADAAVLTAKIGDAQIVTAKIADLAVNDAKIANLAVTSAKIANLAVGTAQIDSLAVTTAKIADANISTAKIADLAVTAAKIGLLQVGTAQIAAAAITSAKIGNLEVGTAHIQDTAITTAKIANLAVTSALIANAAIATAKIADLAVSQLKIGDYVVNAQKIEQYGVTEYDILEATGTYSPPTSTPEGLVVLSSVNARVTVTTPDITGDMAILLMAQVECNCSSAGDTAQAWFTIGSSRISYFGTSRSFDNALESMNLFDIYTSPSPNTSYSFDLRMVADANVDIWSVVFLALLIKR